jgi:tRNA(Ile)-lysidine synthase
LSANSGKWSEFCRELCDDWGIPLRISRVIVESGSPQGLEAAARSARHAVFAGADSDWLALGHHRGDRAETMLFNLLRGTGVRGAGAMPERRGRLLRPLLSVGRREILEYAQTHRLRWVEDESNADTRHSRNFLRHRIIPAIQQRFPAVESRLASAAGHFAEAADLLDDLARLDLGTHPAGFPVPVAVLAGLPDARARNVLRFLLACHGVGMPSEDRLIEALRQFVEAGVDKHPSLAFGHVRMLRRKGLVVLEPV